MFVIGMLLLTISSFGQYAELVPRIEAAGINRSRLTIDIVYADTMVTFIDTTYKTGLNIRTPWQPVIVKAMNFMELHGWEFVNAVHITPGYMDSGNYYLFKKRERN